MRLNFEAKVLVANSIADLEKKLLMKMANSSFSEIPASERLSVNLETASWNVSHYDLQEQLIKSFEPS